MDYDEAIAPFELGEGSKYVLALHGFTGIPYEMRGLSRHLASKGFHIIGPKLPGHGEDKGSLLKHADWQEWWGEIERTIDEIKARSPSHLFVTGLSMGGLFTLYTASRVPEIDAIAPICAPVFVKQKLLTLLPIVKLLRVKYFPMTVEEDIQDKSWLEDPVVIERMKRYDKTVVRAIDTLLKLMKETKSSLQLIKQPILISQSRKDKVIHPSNAPYIFENVRSEEKAILWLENSGHVATEDHDKEQLYTEITRFFSEHCKGK
ncbi:MAG: alpha/beta hydrolase [Candidatus Odinarchaeota archaeon]